MGIHFLYLTEHQWCVILKNIHILIALKEKSNLQCELKRAGDSGSLVQGADEGRSGAISHKVGMIFYCANQGGTAVLETTSLVPVTLRCRNEIFICFCDNRNGEKELFP